MNHRKDNANHFTKLERTGILIFLVLLLFLVLSWRLIPLFIKPEAEDKQYQAAWQKFKTEELKQAEAGVGNRYSSGPSYHADPGKDKVSRLFLFNPNTATEAELTALGLPLRTVRTLIHYRDKGGRFYKKADLKKLYTLSLQDYQRIAPYVRIPASKTPEVVFKKQVDTNEYRYSEKSAYPKAPEFIRLNKTDAQTLIRLRGIGPAYAKRIIAYRDALGGFISVSQLREVYGLPDSTFQQLKGRFIADPEMVRKININTATEAVLARHPYISRLMAKNIVRLRDDLEKFRDITQLKQVPLINEEKYRKIAPYLTVQQPKNKF
jgi:DNA uptake protein ComE-like DNA-binding protein